MTPVLEQAKKLKEAEEKKQQLEQEEEKKEQVMGPDGKPLNFSDMSFTQISGYGWD